MDEQVLDEELLDEPAGPAAPSPSVDPLLLVRLGAERFAVPATAVVEVTRVPGLTRVPGAPGFVRGVVNHRGRVLAVLDLAGMLGVSTVPTTAARIPAAVSAVPAGPAGPAGSRGPAERAARTAGPTAGAGPARLLLCRHDDVEVGLLVDAVSGLCDGAPTARDHGAGSTTGSTGPSRGTPGLPAVDELVGHRPTGLQPTLATLPAPAAALLAGQLTDGDGPLAVLDVGAVVGLRSRLPGA